MKTSTRQTERPRVIDIHCHAAGIGAGGSGCRISDRMRRSWKYGLYLKAFGVTEAEVAAQGDAVIIRRLSERLSGSAEVDSAVVLALDCVVDETGEPDDANTEMYVANDFVSREVKNYGNLHFGASIHPFRRDALDRLHKASADHAVLVKWLPSVQLIDPSDRRLIPFYRTMVELGLPLLTHTGSEHSFTRARNELADPQRLRLPLEVGVTVIAAHAATNGSNGGQSNLERIAPLFARYPNLYADISSLTQLNKIGHLQRLLRHDRITGRLLYGTDMPILATAAVSPLYFIRSLGFRKTLSLLKVDNPWDQDVRMKEALGVPQAVFENSFGVLAARIRAAGKGGE